MFYFIEKKTYDLSLKTDKVMWNPSLVLSLERLFFLTDNHIKMMTELRPQWACNTTLPGHFGTSLTLFCLREFILLLKMQLGNHTFKKWKIINIDSFNNNLALEFWCILNQSKLDFGIEFKKNILFFASLFY